MPELRTGVADSAATSVSPAWGLALVGLVGALAALAAMLDGVLAARTHGSPGGLGRPLGEAARLLRQRRLVTLHADSLLWRVGTAGLFVTAVLMVSVVPLGERTLFDLDVGVMWFNAMDVMVWALVWLAGWGANSAHALIGGYRFLAQALAYELPLMFALVAPVVAARSLNVSEVAAAQDGWWFVTWMPVAFVAYCIGVIAFSVWGPFAPATAADLAGGVRADLSGVDRLLFELGRYSLLVAGAAFAVPMFLGGGDGPVLPSWAWVLVKTLVLVGAFVFLRRRLPLWRPDKFMEVGWMLLLPAVLLQDLVVAVIAAGRS